MALQLLLFSANARFFDFWIDSADAKLTTPMAPPAVLPCADGIHHTSDAGGGPKHLCRNTCACDHVFSTASTGGPANPQYGFANWFLNTDQKALPAAPTSAVYFEGNGRNIVYIDKQHDLVLVARWVAPGDSLNTLIGLLLAALPKA